MFYEEKVISGVLYYRGTPDGAWLPLSIEEITKRYLKLREATQWVLNDAAYKPPEMIGDVAERWVYRLRDAA